MTAIPAGALPAPPPLGRGAASWPVQTGQVFRRWMINTLREPWGLAMSVIQPVVWILLFGQVFSAIANVPGFGDQGYLTFLVPGVLMMTVLYSGAWAGNGYIQDMDRGIMDRMLTSPVSRSAQVSGQLLQQLCVCVLQGLAVVAIGALGGAEYPGGWAGIAVALFASLLLAVIFCSFSVAMALTTGSQTALIGIAQIVVLPATFLSSAMMAPALMPSWAQTISRFNPMTWAVETARTALSGQFDWSLIGTRCLGLTIVAMAAFGWAIAAFGSYRKRL